MNAFLAFLFLALTIVNAEPPRFRGTPNSKFLARQEAAPYPPSGWRPAGEPFRLPPRQTKAPNTAYSAPSQTYGALSQGEPPVNPDVEKLNLQAENRKNEKLQAKPERNTAAKEVVTPLVYLLPQPQFEKLVVANSLGPQGLQYFAKIETQPVYVYTAPYNQAW